MDEIGVVTHVERGIARVLVERKSACEQCSAGTCKLGDAGAELEAENSAGAAVGQKVRVSLSGASFLGNAIMLYGVPMLALIGGAVVGKEFLSPALPSMDPEGASAACGFGAFALSLVLVKLWSKRAEKNAPARPVVEEILE